ncbi:MAG TPA: ABC transporter permease [Xanthobacteraceae bacterium]|nr:ABC transporter permease [Xanthobacteraceae bacterium]
MNVGRPIPISFVLAARNLFRDRIRLVATLIGIIFSVVLVTVELGLFLGFERTVTVMIDHAGADLWIGPAQTKSFEAASFLSGRERFRALPIDGVTQVTPVMIGFTYWRKPDGASLVPIFLVGFQPGADGLKPWNIVAGTLDDLTSPDAVAVDATYFDRLGVKGLGDYAEIGDRRARVAVVTKGIRSFATTPYVFAPIDRVRSWIGAPAEAATYFQVRVAPGADVAAIRARLAADLPDADVLTADEFRSRSRSFWLFETGAGAALFASALLALIVGTVIVGQTLYSSTKDHVGEFATLRAIGSPRGYIYRIILLQALVSAVIGFVIATSAGAVLARLSVESALPIVMTPALILALFVLTLLMCIASAVSAIVVVMRLDPVTAFAR